MPVKELAAALTALMRDARSIVIPGNGGHCCPLGSDLGRLTTAANTGTTSRSIARIARDEQFQTQFEVRAEPRGT